MTFARTTGAKRRVASTRVRLPSRLSHRAAWISRLSCRHRKLNRSAGGTAVSLCSGSTSMVGMSFRVARAFRAALAAPGNDRVTRLRCMRRWPSSCGGLSGEDGLLTWDGGGAGPELQSWEVVAKIWTRQTHVLPWGPKGQDHSAHCIEKPSACAACVW